MTTTTLPSATPMIPGGVTLTWDETLRRFSRGGTYWLATVSAEGRPHCVPVLAVLAGDTVFFVAGHATRKARNLAVHSTCVLTTGIDDFDLILEGRAERVADTTTLQRVADAYAAKYGWPVTVRDGAFHDTEGAPTAGPPPYGVYAIAPSAAFALGTREEIMSAATRWHW